MKLNKPIKITIITLLVLFTIATIIVPIALYFTVYDKNEAPKTALIIKEPIAEKKS